jgi:hypothetical protein
VLSVGASTCFSLIVDGKNFVHAVNIPIARSKSSRVVSVPVMRQILLTN